MHVRRRLHLLACANVVTGVSAAAASTPQILVNTSAVLHTVDGGFVSFALDQPWLVNFTAAAAGRSVIFSSPVLRAVTALVGAGATASGRGGFIRLGGQIYVRNQSAAACDVAVHFWQILADYCL